MASRNQALENDARRSSVPSVNADLHVTATELNNTLDLTPFDDGAVVTPALALLTSEQFEARRRPAARAARP